MNRRYKTLSERLLANSKEVRCHDRDPARPWTEKPCRIWCGCLNSDGYGSITIRSRHRYKVGKREGERIPKRFHAHRVAKADALGVQLWRLNKCMHLCDNRPCIEESHIRSTTQLRNDLDRTEKGRTRNGYLGPLPENAHMYDERRAAA